MRSVIRLLLQAVTVTVICMAAAFGALFGFDRWGIDAAQPRLQGIDVKFAQRTIRTLDLYLWTAWQAQDQFHHSGPLDGETTQPYSEFELTNIAAWVLR